MSSGSAQKLPSVSRLPRNRGRGAESSDCWAGGLETVVMERRGGPLRAMVAQASRVDACPSGISKSWVSKKESGFGWHGASQ